MRRAALSVLLVAAAVVLQLTVVNRLPLPGGGAPDLVLLVVIAIGLCGGPAAGSLAGFCAGLSLDLAPPASQLIGEYALVFCVIGYCCGKLRGTLSQSALLPMGIAAAAAAAGELLYAGLGLVLDPAEVTWASVRQLLPSAVGYDVVIGPVVLYLVVLATSAVDPRALGGAAPARPGGATALLRRARAAGGGMPAGLGGPGLAGDTGPLGGAGLLGGTGWISGPQGSRAARKAAARRAPQLGKSAARDRDGWIGNGPPSWRVRAVPLRRGAAPARLRPGAGVAGSAARDRSGLRQPGAAAQRRPVHLKLAASRRQAGKSRQAAGPASGGLPRISFSGSSHRRGAAGRPGAGRGSVRRSSTPPCAQGGVPARAGISRRPGGRPRGWRRGGRRRAAATADRAASQGAPALGAAP